MATDPPATPAPPPAAPDAPPQPSPGSRARVTPIPQQVTDLRDLVVAYVKQETVAPLRSLGRWVGFGVAGSLLLGFGVVFLALGALRVLQTETGETFTGNWSWAPYLIVVVALVLGAALVWYARGVRKSREEAT